MNYCVIALSVFSSDIPACSADSYIKCNDTLVRVEEYTYCVNKLHQNVGLETWIWRQIVTSKTADTK